MMEPVEPWAALISWQVPFKNLQPFSHFLIPITLFIRAYYRDYYVDAMYCICSLHGFQLVTCQAPPNKNHMKQQNVLTQSN